MPFGNKAVCCGLSFLSNIIGRLLLIFLMSDMVASFGGFIWCSIIISVYHFADQLWLNISVCDFSIFLRSDILLLHK